MQTLEKVNTILQGDCIELMNQLPQGSIDLAFADPPFNIGYDYDVYHDQKEYREYLDWSRRWIGAVHRVLKPTGTFWLAIGDDYAAELKLLSQELGFACRSWVIWYYTFGVNCKQKFTRSHAHLFYFVKDPNRFTFRGDELENRIPSARQLVYADARANPKGRLPDDTWVLRPQDLADRFTASEDTWYIPRVAGTFKERAGFHGCQMPEQLLGRIIRICSQEGDVVFDPFSGSATTAAVAKKLGRRYLAIDLSKDYVSRGKKRLEDVCVGDPLEGAAEPTMSAPATFGPRNVSAKQNRPPDDCANQSDGNRSRQLQVLRTGLREAFRAVYNGFSLDRVVADPELNQALAAKCRELGLPGDARTWNHELFGLRKLGSLNEHPAVKRTEFPWEHCEKYLFASEIAWRQMLDGGCESLDEILCDPYLANEFDAIARRWAPNFTSLEYRWAALKLRKGAKKFRSRGEILNDQRFSKLIEFDPSNIRNAPSSSGVYLIRGAKKKPLFVGVSFCLHDAFEQQLRKKAFSRWNALSDELFVQYFPTESPSVLRLAYRWRCVQRLKPQLNYIEIAGVR